MIKSELIPLEDAKTAAIRAWITSPAAALAIAAIEAEADHDLVRYSELISDAKEFPNKATTAEQFLEDYRQEMAVVSALKWLSSRDKFFTIKLTHHASN